MKKNIYFEVNDIESIKLVRFLRSLDKDAAGILQAQIEEWKRTEAQIFVFDFAAVENIDRVVYRHLFDFGKFLARHKTAATALNLHGKVEVEIRQTTIGAVLRPIREIQEAKKFAIPKERPRDDTFVKAFISSAKDCFADYFKTPIQDALIEYDWTPSEPAVDIEVASFVRSTDSNRYPSVLLGLPLTTFINVYENMFAERITRVTEEEADTIVELLNMLFGKVKGYINMQTGQTFEVLVPQFTSYHDLLTEHHLDTTQNTFIEYTSPAGPFFVLLIYEKTALKQAA